MNKPMCRFSFTAHPAFTGRGEYTAMVGHFSRDNLVPENVYYQNNIASVGPGDLPLRYLSSVSIFDLKGNMVAIEMIEKKGPFCATGIPVGDPKVDSSDKREDSVLVLLERITEYSLEYPYGKAALIWLKSACAHYAVTSVDPLYSTSAHASFFQDATICGHVINAFINLKKQRSVLRVILRACRLGRTPRAQDFLEVIARRRSFLIEQFFQQRIACFSRTRIHRFLSDDSLWQKKRIRTLALVLTRELAKREGIDCISSSGDDEDEEQRRSILTEPHGDSEPPARMSDVIVTPTDVAGLGHGTGAKLSTTEVASCIMESVVVAVEGRAFPAALGASAHALAIQLPTQLALHYKCPFCSLVIKRTNETLCIVELTIDHFQQHLSCNRFSIPIASTSHPKTLERWPALHSDRDHARLAHWKLPSLPICHTPTALPLEIVMNSDEEA